MSNGPPSAQRIRTSRIIQAIPTSQGTPSKPADDAAASPSSKTRRSSWETNSLLSNAAPAAVQDQPPPTIDVHQLGSQQDTSVYEPSLIPSFAALPASAPPPYAPQGGSSPTKRPIPRVPAPAYRDSSPEVWELTRDLMAEFKGLTRANSSPPPTLPSTLLGTQDIPDRVRQTASYQSSRYDPPRSSETQPLRTPITDDPAQRAKPAEQTQGSSLASLRQQRGTPPARPLIPAQTSERRLPIPPITPSTRSDTQDSRTTRTTPTYYTALTTPAGDTTTATSTNGLSPPFAFDRPDLQAPIRPPHTEMGERPRGTPERSARPIDDRDDVEEDRTPPNEDTWHASTLARQGPSLVSLQDSHSYPDFSPSLQREHRGSPTPSSALIPTDDDQDDLDYLNTPRSPPVTLPEDRSINSVFSQSSGMNSMEQVMLAIQLARQLPAPIPTYPREGINFAEGHPSVPFDMYPSREPSVAAPSISASWNGAFQVRPSAPIPPTPNTHTNAPTPALPPPPSMSVSSYSPSPYPGFNPFLPPHVSQSLESSPSHVPMPLGHTGSRTGFPRRAAQRYARPPPSESGESTEPQETESEGEENEDDLWVDEPSDDDLEAEYHPTFVVHPGKRRQRFEQKYSSLLKEFRELDRATDSTMMLFVSAPDQRHTHLVMSRGILRQPTYMAYAHSARSSFAFIAEARRRERAVQARARQREEQRRALSMSDEQATHAAFAQLANLDVNGIDGEENLKHALDVALSSLRQLHQIYELREERRKEEAQRQIEEQTNIEAMLKVLGVSRASGSSS